MDLFFTGTIYMPYVALAILVPTFVCTCRLGRWAQVIWTILLFFALQMFKGFAVLGGDVWRPELPEVLIWCWCVAFFGALILATLSPWCWFWKSRRKAVVLPALALGIAAYGVWGAIKLPSVREVEIRDAGLPSELDGYRIVQIADIHASGTARRWRTEGIVRLVNALKPDLVCLTGDQTDGTVAQRFRDIEPLRELRTKDGVFAVTGNHEHFYDMAEWRPVYRDLGIRLLENEVAFPRRSLALGGVNAFNAPGEDAPDVSRAFAAATNGEYRVLMQHRPNPAEENFSVHRVGLQLSGHTHGGFMPILDRFVSKAHYGWLRGVYKVGKGQLVVSPGCGPWPALPLRYFDPAEIVVLVLRRR